MWMSHVTDEWATKALSQPPPPGGCWTWLIWRRTVLIVTHVTPYCADRGSCDAVLCWSWLMWRRTVLIVTYVTPYRADRDSFDALLCWSWLIWCLTVLIVTHLTPYCAYCAYCDSYDALLCMSLIWRLIGFFVTHLTPYCACPLVTNLPNTRTMSKHFQDGIQWTSHFFHSFSRSLTYSFCVYSLLICHFIVHMGWLR